MADLINGRTPEEIKTGLYRCKTVCLDDCPYYKKGIKCSECTVYLARDALALIEHLEAQIPKWISVEERLPTEGDVVFGWLGINAGLILVYQDGAFRDLAFEEPTMMVTHWMLLPEPPTEED